LYLPALYLPVMITPCLLAFVVLGGGALRSPVSAPRSAALAFRPCRLVNDHGDKTSRLDTSGAGSNAVYARLGPRVLCVHKCGSLYVFPAGKPTAAFRPTYFVQTCSGKQVSYAEQAVASGDRYVFLCSDHDTYLTRPRVKLLRVDLYTATVQVLDAGDLGPELTVEAGTNTLAYRKEGKRVTFSCLSVKRTLYKYWLVILDDRLPER
jgi:hypothetical protein